MKKIIITLTIFFLSSSFVCASNVDIQQTFKKIITVDRINILVPTVVEIELPNEILNSYFAVFNQTDEKFEPYQTINSLDSSRIIPQKITANSVNSENLFDTNYQTSVEFDVDQNGRGSTKIIYSFAENIESNSLTLSLDQFVSLPNAITIRANVNGTEKIILSQFKPTSNKINFPLNQSKEWEIDFEYSQPLRINELQILSTNIKQSPSRIRFLAQPNKNYQIYTDPDMIIDQNTGERPNLLQNNDIKVVSILQSTQNPFYKQADTDNDTIPDSTDNCVLIANTDQKDIDGNNRGDVCDDYDKDGIINSSDNCINEPNANQADVDGDSIGDACDGIESRLTERNPWIVWGGIGLATLIFLGLFAVALRKMRFEREIVDSKNTHTPNL